MHKNNLKLGIFLVYRISYLIKNIININSKTLTLIKATNDDVNWFTNGKKNQLQEVFSFNSNVQDWDKHRKWMPQNLKI